MNQISLILPNTQATVALGEQLAQVIKQLDFGMVVYLNGSLGAGKTTLTRGFVQGMGHQGNVKSPTYTLVEPYDLTPWQVYHFDLYRLSDPEELEYMGIRDYFIGKSCTFIEWPEKGQGAIASADLIINLAYSGEQRTVELFAKSTTGQSVLALLTQYLNS